MTDQRNDKMLIYKALTFVNHVIGYIVAYAPATFKLLVATEVRVFCDMTVWYGYALA